MLANFLLALTSFSYIGLAVLNFQKANGTGERLMGIGLISIGLIALYVIFSLLLTINIASKGGFNWVSPSTSTRNILVGILWLGMIIGVVFCGMLSTEMSTDRTTGLFRTLSMPVYYGTVWLPLLMLIPYALLINTPWRESVPAFLYKVPLVMACILGFVIVMIPQIVSSMNIEVPKQSNEDWKKETLVPSIEKETSVEILLTYARDEDAWVRDLAVNRLKSLPQWEDPLVKTLQKTDEYGHYDFRWIYLFLDQYTVDHPDRFVEPINNTLEALAKATIVDLNKNFVYSGDIDILQIDVVCRVLAHQFKDSSKVFRPNMLKIQEALDTPIADPSQITPEVVELLKTYRVAVKEWLERNKEG